MAIAEAIAVLEASEFTNSQSLAKQMREAQVHIGKKHRKAMCAMLEQRDYDGKTARTRLQDCLDTVDKALATAQSRDEVYPLLVTLSQVHGCFLARVNIFETYLTDLAALIAS